MTKGTRRIVVDDADVGRIQYSDGWFTESGTHDSFSFVNGPTYEHTQHGTMADWSSFSFLFNGSSVQVFGSWDQFNNATLPSWECFVDGGKIESQEPSPPSRNQKELCWEENIDGTQEHALTVNITLSRSNVNFPFWLNYIVYTPYDGDLYNHTTLWLGKDDEAISWSGSWADNDGARMATAKGASLSAKFNGSSIRMVGPIQNATYSSSGEYAIDGGNASTFYVSRTSSMDPILWSQPLFQSDPLSPDKEHSIIVRSNGLNDWQQFGIENFYIETPMYPAEKDNSDNTSAPKAIIVGSVVGGVVLLAAIAGVLLFWRRRNRYATLSKAEFDLSGLLRDPFSAGHPFFASSNVTVTPYDPYADSYGGPLATTPTPTRDSFQTSYSGASSAIGSMLSPTSAGLTPSSANLMPIGAQSRSSLTLSPPPNEQSALIAMKNEQSFAMASTQSLVSPSPSGSSPSQFRKHQDSGLRLTNNDGEVVDLPPDYEHS